MANSSIGYEAFLREKIRLAPLSGFECEAHEVNPLLKPHQRDIVQWAVRGGSRAIFAAFGLGKTFMQIESVRLRGDRDHGRSVLAGDGRDGEGEGMSECTRPLIRYHGGKWRLADWIIQHFPRHRVYVEPFGGGGAVLLRKPRSHSEVYGDLDGDIVNLFRVARDCGTELHRALTLTPFARAEFDMSYQPCADPLERARRTVVRAFMGFGSGACNSAHQTGFRSGKRNSGTSPSADWRNYPDALAAIIERLQGVVIEHRNALDLMPQHDAVDTLYYVDPPYPYSTRRIRGSGVYRHEMTDDQHRELASVLHGLQGAVVLSGYPCALYDRELFPCWRRVERTAMADGGRPRTEVLWMNARAIAGAVGAQPGLFEAAS